MLPKTLMCEMFGTLPCQSSKGVSVMLFVGNLFWRYVAVIIVASHIRLGNSASESMHLVISRRDLSFLSAIPFCSGVYGTVRLCRIPCSSKNVCVWFEMYSPPLSDWNAWGFLPNLLLTIATYFRRWLWVSLLSLSSKWHSTLKNHPEKLEYTCCLPWMAH